MSEACVVTPKLITFTASNVINTLNVYNPHPYSVKFAVLSNQPDYYQIKGSKGELAAQKSMTMVKKEKQSELFSQPNTEEALTHTFLVKSSALETTGSETDTSEKKKQTSSVRSVIKLGAEKPTITMSQSLPPASTSFNHSPVPERTPKSILRTKPQEKNNYDDDDDDERPVTWDGILSYLPVLFGAVMVLFLTYSQNIDSDTSKVVWAAFLVGLGAMFVQLKILFR